MTDTTRKPQNASVGLLVDELLKRDHGYDPDVPGSKMEAAAALGERLGLQPYTVVHISNGGYCGRATASHIRALHTFGSKKKNRERYVAYVPCPDAATRDRIHRNIPADERHISLAMLAAHEED